MSLLFTPTQLGSLRLQNRMVMSPMTRSRAIDNVPNELMAKYYGQRSSAGLIITEGTATSANALGYARIPGVFSAAQIEGWKLVTAAAHQGGAKIFLQLMHTGRIAHPLNLPDGARVIAPSAIAAKEQMYTDAQGTLPLPTPEEMSVEDIKSTIEEYVQAATNALTAGFDGVELHGANGYLLEQFIRPTSNHRKDAHGGSIENRQRFLLEVVRTVAKEIGKDRLGLRLSPYGVFNDMPPYDGTESDYAFIAQSLNDSESLAYVHLVDHTAMGAPAVPNTIRETFRKRFGGTLILSGGYDAERAESDLAAGRADLIAVGRPFLANPDLPTRWKTGSPLNAPDFETLYTPGEKGYIDYPSLA
jgi:N-ethylmaleimide reductase